MQDNVNHEPENRPVDKKPEVVSDSGKSEAPLTAKLDETMVMPDSMSIGLDPDEITGDGILRLELVDTKQALTVPIKEYMLLGRPDPVTGKSPDIDFTRLAGYRMGVSRRHAEIHWYRDNVLKIFDLGSSNGTWINGERLETSQAYPLYNGDELRLGQLALYVYYEIIHDATPDTLDENKTDN